MNLRVPIMSNPTREVPLSTRIAVLLGGRSKLRRLGWVFFGFGIFLAINLAGHADLTSWYLFRGKIETVPGIVTTVKNTRFTEGGNGGRYSHGGGTPVCAYAYHFNYNQTEYQGVSYDTGMSKKTGATVTVEFPVNRPDISRIQTMRRGAFGPGIAFVLIFPLVGLIFITINLIVGHKILSSFIYGESAYTGGEITNDLVIDKGWFRAYSLKAELRGMFDNLVYNEYNSSRIAPLSPDERGQVPPCGILDLLGVLWLPLLGIAMAAAGFVVDYYTS